MTALGSLADVNPRERRPSGWPLALITMADVDAATATATPRVARDAEQAGSALRAARPGDVLFARISPSMENGKVAIVPELRSEVAVVSTEFHVLRPHDRANARLLWAYLRQDRLRAQLVRSLTGSSGLRRVPEDVLRALDVPEHDEQARGLEALSQLDRAAELRREALALTERLPASVAAATLAGRPRRPLADALIDTGTSERASERGELPLLRPTNLVDGYLDTTALRFLPAGVRVLSPLEPGDLLLARVAKRARFGVPAIYEGEPPGARHSSQLIRVRAPEWCEPVLLWAWLQTAQAGPSPDGSSLGDNVHLSVRNVRALEVPLVRGGDRADLAALVRAARGAHQRGRQQAIAFDRLVQALLGQLFHGAVMPGFVSSERPTGSTLSALIAGVASPRQLELLERALTLEQPFAVSELAGADADRLDAEQALALLEALGLLVHDDLGELDRWRVPEPATIGARAEAPS